MPLNDRGPKPPLANPAMPGTLLVPLTRGLFAIIDDVDEDVAKHRWYAQKSTNTYYAQRSVIRDGIRTAEQVHSLIAPRIGIVGRVDHENRCGLDNRRVNLRRATRSQNEANKSLRKDNRSGFKGVSWNRTSRKWQAAIRANGLRRYLGVFADPGDAGRAYDAAAREVFGEYAALNFPEAR